MSKTYYNIADDIAAYPKAWAFIIVGGRNTGKTYGTLDYFRSMVQKITFVKRTNEDVDTLCAGNSIGKKGAEYEVDFSPYKSINRDKGTSIKAFKIKNGLGGFYNTSKDGEAVGSPVSYLVSLYSVNKVKGFDLSDSEALVFDEFIPQPWERINRKEGEQLMDLYKTVARDRTLRGRSELKLICLANAVNIYNPTCEILEVTDIMAEMCAKHTDTYYNEDRGIFIRILKTSDEMMAAEKKTGIYKSMADTAWGRMAFGNEFAYNDFSCIKQVALKGYQPNCCFDYKGKRCYIYLGPAGWYLTNSAFQNPEIVYNLDTETGQRAFYYDKVIDIMNDTIDGRGLFKKYTYYDLIMNFKKRFII